MAKVSRVRANAPVEDENTTESEETTTKVSRVATGWGGSRNKDDEERPAHVKSDYLVLKDNGKRVIKVLDEAPFRFQRHYVQSRRGYVACNLPAAECPLSQAGHKYAWGYMLNVVDLKGYPEKVLTWTFGPEAADQIQEILEDKELALNDEGLYFEVYHHKVPNRQAPATKVQFVRAKYLEDEHGLLPLNAAEIAELEEKMYGSDAVFLSTRKFLEGVAEELQPSDFPNRK